MAFAAAVLDAEAFLKIAVRIADFHRGRDGLSWAFGITAYEIKTHLRKLQRRREVSSDDELAVIADAGVPPDVRLIEDELNAALEMIGGYLTPKDRDALGFDGSPVHDVFGTALRKRRQRALEKLRSLWKAFYGH